MTMTLSGDGSITGLVAGGLPDATITQAEIATGVAGKWPAFSAYGSALQSAANTTYVKIAYNNKEFDTASCYDTANYRFTPNVAGYYQVNAMLDVTGAASGGALLVLYKNGSAFKSGVGAINQSFYPRFTLNALVYMNGSTDYLEIYGWQNSGGNLNIGSGGAAMAFSGCLVRAA